MRKLCSTLGAFVLTNHFNSYLQRCALLEAPLNFCPNAELLVGAPAPAC